MNPYANPTNLRVGMSGTLCGLRYRIVGRVVLGMDEAGTTYYWNEFNLRDDSGPTATLVFEETELGPEWKLFFMFEPAERLTAVEAARQRVGQSVNVTGTPTAVTLVGQSRVYHIEGDAPEGVEVGDIAEYFNADTGDQMLVVSWTGDEVEYYRGMDVRGDLVATAFSVPSPLAARAAAYEPAAYEPAAGAWTGGANAGRLMKFVAVGIVLVVFWMGWGPSCRARFGDRLPPKPPTRPSPLATGASGPLADRRCTVVGHAVVAIDRIDARYDWHEYHLRDALDEPALLVCGLNGRSNAWHFCRPATLTPELTPAAAAALGAGQTVTVDGQPLRIEALFQARVQAVEGQPPTGVTPAAVTFGFLAHGSNRWALVRWNQAVLTCESGPALAEKDVLAGLPGPPAGR